MATQLRWLAALCVLLQFAEHACADVAPCLKVWARRDVAKPPPFADREFDLVILRDPKIEQAELRIPRRLATAEAPAQRTTRVAMAGLALSAAFVGGGLWCLRFRGQKIPRQKWLGAGALVLLLAGSLAWTSFAEADVVPPPWFEGMPRTVLLGEISVDVQFVETGDQVQLAVPTAWADKIAAR